MKYFENGNSILSIKEETVNLLKNEIHSLLIDYYEKFAKGINSKNIKKVMENSCYVNEELATYETLQENSPIDEHTDIIQIDLIKKYIDEISLKIDQKIENRFDKFTSDMNHQFGEISGILKGISDTSDLIINGLGKASQRSTREMIETQNLVNKYIDILKSDNPKKENELKKMVSGLPYEVIIALMADVIKEIFHLPK